MAIANVLLVDDERIILEGISRIVDWGSCGTALIGTARNGLEAMAFVDEHKPHIVITDIKMPGMDGLQLVEYLHENHPDIAVIMLSGFSEFDYARKAMRFGVKHYLLKPCNEQTIMNVLQDTVAELNRSASKEQFAAELAIGMKKVLPHAKEQFLKELVTNRTYGRQEWDDYRSLFGMPDDIDRIRLALVQPEGNIEFEHLFACKNIAEDVLGQERLVLATTIGKQVLLLVRDEPDEELLYSGLMQMKKTFTAYYKMDATIAVSSPGPITEARRRYLETMECLRFRFYLGEGSLIMPSDAAVAGSALAGGTGGDRPDADFNVDEETICLLVKSGRWEDAKEELNALFGRLRSARLDNLYTKALLIPLYAAIIRQGDEGRMRQYLQSLARLDEHHTLHALQTFVMDAAKDICLANYEQFVNRHSQMIARMLEVIETHMGNSELSLQWVAGEILYMNADYLGKLFKKETGEKFSNYVMKRRIEQAIAWLTDDPQMKVFELAERLGFGNNPQYFSQVFKKATGWSPSEYKRPTV